MRFPRSPNLVYLLAIIALSSKIEAIFQVVTRSLATQKAATLLPLSQNYRKLSSRTPSFLDYLSLNSQSKPAQKNGNLRQLKTSAIASRTTVDQESKALSLLRKSLKKKRREPATSWSKLLYGSWMKAFPRFSTQAQTSTRKLSKSEDISRQSWLTRLLFPGPSNISLSSFNVQSFGVNRVKDKPSVLLHVAYVINANDITAILEYRTSSDRHTALMEENIQKYLAQLSAENFTFNVSPVLDKTSQEKIAIIYRSDKFQLIHSFEYNPPWVTNACGFSRSPYVAVFAVKSKPWFQFAVAFAHPSPSFVARDLIGLSSFLEEFDRYWVKPNYIRLPNFMLWEKTAWYRKHMSAAMKNASPLGGLRRLKSVMIMGDLKFVVSPNSSLV